MDLVRDLNLATNSLEDGSFEIIKSIQTISTTSLDTPDIQLNNYPEFEEIVLNKAPKINSILKRKVLKRNEQSNLDLKLIEYLKKELILTAIRIKRFDVLKDFVLKQFDRYPYFWVESH